ncbi:EamA family transporter [Glutamicibacter sp. PS]|uniref:DMT family transporter n=1 Tax=Glutamicibacter sp. PS TaxID=3075634 RepID=UPI002841306A|nr:EamA family transporter [Glutamicibacter sp. PS]MDR4534697.1 EamA family transporter [Glutamicibacter sp. PS]
MTTRATAGMLPLLVASVLWGTTGTAAHFAQGLSPLAIGAASLGFGGLLQACIALPALRSARAQLAIQLRTIVVGALGIVVYPLAFYSSMAIGGIALGTIISLGSAPLFCGVLERLLGTGKLTRRWWASAGLGIAGTALLGVSRTAGQDAMPVVVVAISVGLGLLAGASYAVYSWATACLLSAGVPRGAAVGSIFGLGGLLLMPVFVITSHGLFAAAHNVLVLAYLAVIPMFLGYLLFGMALTHVSASTATTVTLSEPAVAAVLAVLIAGERLGVYGWCGIALIGLSLILLLSPARPRVKPPARGDAKRDRPVPVPDPS